MPSYRLKTIIAAFAALILFQLFSLFQNGVWGIIFVAPLLLGVLLVTALALFSSEHKKTSSASAKARAAASFEANSPATLSSSSDGSEPERVQGEVKWFNPEKGFGFIAQDSGDDLFVHYTEVHLEDNEFLEKGDRVELKVGPGRKGPVAKNVIRLSRAEKKDESTDTDDSSESRS